MNKFLPAVCLSTLLVGAALPAHASTFATIAGDKISWVRPGSGPARGTLVSAGNNTFDFLIAGLPSGLVGELTLNVSETGSNAQTFTGGGTTVYDQGGINGTFNEIYNGTTETVDGVHLVKGITSLLSGTLSSGELVATKVTSGGVTTSLAGDLTATVSDYTSPFIPQFLGAQSLDFTIALSRGNWGVTNRTVSGNSTSTLNAFSSATASGNFLGSTVVEPGSWAMMLTGFGFAGVALRRRRTAGLPA